MTDEQKITEEEKEIMTDHYELLYLLPMSYTAEEVKPINAKVNNLITTNGGEITKEEDLGKQKLAYPIKQQSHGYYQLVEFDMATQSIDGLNKILKLSGEIIRFILVKKKIKSEQEIAKEKALQEKLTKQKEKAIDKIKEDKKESKEKPAKEKEQKKVSLEDLDKKLDEILDTDDII